MAAYVVSRPGLTSHVTLCMCVCVCVCVCVCMQVFDDRNVTLINETRFNREGCNDTCYHDYAMIGMYDLTGH